MGPNPERSSPAGGAVFVAGVLLLAFNLRPAVTAVPSILREIGVHEGYSSVVLTVLTTVPVLCFGLFSPVATRLGRRFGDEPVLGAAVVAIAAGLAWRSLSPATGFFPGTVVAGAGIALMNVLLASLVKRRAPRRAAQLLGAYLAMLYVGAMAGSALSVPIYDAGGGSVPLALGVWAVPAGLAFLAWLPQVGRHTVTEPGDAGVRLVRTPLAWAVTGFMGLQSLTFYAAISFLPDLYRSRGLDASTAGLVNTMLSVGGLVTGVAAPAVVARFRVDRAVLVASTVLGVASTVGTLLLPTGASLPLALVLGASQGVSISLALYYIMARSQTPAVAGALSGMAQGVGYVIATAGPLSFGLLHTATGSWGAPVAVLSVLTALTLVFGLLASRRMTITAGGEVLASSPALAGAARQPGAA